MLNEKSIEIYSSRDKIREQLIELAKDYMQLENFDFNKSSYLSYILNMLSFLDSNLLYYVSSVYREQFLSKAIQRESVLNLSNMLGYKPPLATPATCKILIEIPYQRDLNYTRTLQFIGRNHQSVSVEDSSSSVFKVYSNDNIPFSLINTTLIEISKNDIVQVNQQVFMNNFNNLVNGWKTVEHRFVNGKIQIILDFIQLVTVTETFTIPELLPNEFHNITYNFNKTGKIADIQLFTVTTNTNGVVEKWNRKESIFGIGPDESAYTYRETEDGIVISFGNGVIGKQPKKGTNVVINVGLTQGYNGNVISGTIRKSDSVRMVNDTTSGKVYSFVNLNVLNNEPSQFGIDPPTIDEVRRDAMNSVSANKRLVSHRDYENANLIVPNLPIRNVFQVLKRSDLKRNEISLFTELIYNNVVVPTRNTTLQLSSGVVDEATAHHIKAEVDTITIDDEEYITLFDLYLNTITNEINYTYIISESQKPVTILSTLKTIEPTKILPIFASFVTDRTGDAENDELVIELHCNVLDSTSKYKCELNVEWPTVNGLNTYNLFDSTSVLDSSTTSVKVFSTRLDADNTSDTATPILLSNVPNGSSMEFTFTISKILGNTITELNKSRCSIIIKKDLSDFMYSQVELTEGIYFVHDVPVIKKDYYENLINKRLFTSTVLQKIVDFNVYEYKMVTDFVNLKFANTTGYSTNMKYRSTTKSNVIDINPTSIPTTGTAGVTRYALTNNDNPWALDPNYDITGGGYIAYYVSNENWAFEKLKVNDIIFVTNLNGRATTTEADYTKMVYTGSELVEPKFNIPLEIKMVVIPSDNSLTTDQILVKTIKDTLVTKLSPYFGYNKSILRSVISKIVQDIAGVEHVEILEPKFNIKFELDPYKNMTQEQLLRYTPELIFFSTENIFIELRDE